MKYFLQSAIILALSCTVLAFMAGCDDDNPSSANPFNPVGLWQGEKLNSDSVVVKVTYGLLVDNTYWMNYKLSDEIRYHEEGEWSHADNQLNITPTLSAKWNAPLQQLEQSSTPETKYTLIILEDIIMYDYIDANSNQISIALSK